MNNPNLLLPVRTTKMRDHGITILIDGGLPTGYFEDVISSHHPLIDFVKFGWGTAMVSENLGHKIRVLQQHGVKHVFGGTLFEKFVSQGRTDDYLRFCLQHECEFVEISNGTIEMSNQEKGAYIRAFSESMTVFSEVGFKDSEKSLNLPPNKWLEYIKMDMEAGAYKVITEARESGTSGICRPNGEVRFGLIEEIVDSGIDLRDVVFEAPNKDLQTYFVKRLGTNVNVANVAFDDVVPLETLRLGLRSDTLLTFDRETRLED